MEKFTKPELLDFLCAGENNDIAGTSPWNEEEVEKEIF